MLIIAMPRTASTSFAKTLAEVIGVEWSQVLGKVRDNRRNKRFPLLSKLHSDCRVWDDVETYAKARELYKQHIPPPVSEEYILLIRNPKEIIESYKRIGKETPKGLEEELIEFMIGHIPTAKAVISFNTITQNTDSAIRTALDVFGLDIEVSGVELAKERYIK